MVEETIDVGSDSDVEISIEEDIESMREELEPDADLTRDIPRVGNFYVFRVTLDDGSVRYLISPLNATSTFSFKKREVQTEYGIAEAPACAMQLKLVGVAPDYRTGRLIGVYQVMSADNFVKAGLKVQELRDSLDRDLLRKQLLAIEYNTALRLKHLLDLRNQEIMTLQRAVRDFTVDIPQAASEMAAAMVTYEELALKSAQESLKKLSTKKWAFINSWWFWAMIILAILAFIAFLPTLGGR